ncbi:DNA repair protein RadC [Chitinophaga polysaccharea]|uniref:DNA repair protein RadC n=1 Tax=Chitinophaga polysaccharea TaxID=1293035 RepID=A0A561P0Y1_9BACT|nr:JAB domain-containing protein [Chitinophaga polysaccharea]TWF31730.1 DNA repair protein RadC [Chitinophaga polysaccharea]
MELNNQYEVSEIEVIIKRSYNITKRPKINSSSDAADIFRELWDNDRIELQEQFKVMYLNQQNSILGVYQLSTGGMTSTVVDIRLLFGAAVKLAATKIILAHNHPSESLKPSQADIRVTRKIRDAAAVMDIELMDHIIITPSNGYFSLAEDGLL